MRDDGETAERLYGKGGGVGRGIVRFGEGLGRSEGWCGNPSGSRPNFFG